MPAMPDQEIEDGEDCVFAAAIRLAAHFDESEWALKKQALDEYYLGLRGTNSAWVREEDRRR